MPALNSYDYAIVRVVPCVERGEYINAGVILFCRTRRFLDALTYLDIQRLTTLFPAIDHDLVQRHLDIIPVVCAGSALFVAPGPEYGRYRKHFRRGDRRKWCGRSRCTRHG